jgi:hypothetical protein
MLSTGVMNFVCGRDTDNDQPTMSPDRTKLKGLKIEIYCALRHKAAANFHNALIIMCIVWCNLEPAGGKTA